MASYSETGLVATATAIVCVGVSALAVATVKPIQQSASWQDAEREKLFLAYHDKVPSILYLVGVAALLLAARGAPNMSEFRRSNRIALAVIAGAAAAQYVSYWLWRESGDPRSRTPGGVPDYLHIVGVLNLADVAIFAAIATIIITGCVTAIGWTARRLTTSTTRTTPPTTKETT